MNPEALLLPGIARGGKHGGLASASKADHHCNLLRPCDVLNGDTLLFAQACTLDLPLSIDEEHFTSFNFSGERSCGSCPNGLIL